VWGKVTRVRKKKGPQGKEFRGPGGEGRKKKDHRIGVMKHFGLYMCSAKSPERQNPVIKRGRRDRELSNKRRGERGESQALARFGGGVNQTRGISGTLWEKKATKKGDSKFSREQIGGPYG